jgi:CBS domain-containing protein
MVKVQEIMTKDVVTVGPDQLVKDAAVVLAKKDISGAPVVDGGRIVGVFSEADILRSIKTTKKDLRLIYPSLSSLGIAFQEHVTQREVLEAYEEVGRLPVSEVMSREIVFVDPEMSVSEAISKMVERNITRMPVVKNGMLMGIVTRGDVIKGLAKEHGSDVD